MSYSVCIVCKEMVSAYQKYCNACLIKHNVKQNDDWNKEYHPDIDSLKEINKDKYKE